MNGTKKDYQAYLLRLWRDGEEEQWRILLEDVQTGKRESFAGIQSLMQYIQAVSQQKKENS